MREGVHLLLAGSQQDFPVVDNVSLVGLLPHTNLLRDLGGQGEGADIASAMQRDFETLDANELLRLKTIATPRARPSRPTDVH